jgi:hypothetical protein
MKRLGCWIALVACGCLATLNAPDARPSSEAPIDASAPALDEDALRAFLPRFATASCDADARCGTRFTSLRLGSVPEDCEAEIASTAPYLSWLGHAARFDAAQADACIAFLSNAPCIDVARALRGGAFAEVCRDVVRATGEVCSSRPTGGGIGAPCTSSIACDSGIRCDLATSTCVAGDFRIGEACEPELGCASRELVCVEVEGAFQCATPRTDGTCRPSPSDTTGQRGDCARDHFCGEGGLCVHLPELDEPCGAAHPDRIATCDEDLVCDEGRCVRALFLTQPCASDASCRSDRCEGGLCALPSPVLCVR